MKFEELLKDPETTATSAFLALWSMLGGDCCEDWEPEAVRLEIEDLGIEVAEENVEAFMAIRASRLHPAFAWDANVFENLTLALNNEPVDPGSIQYVTPPHIAWAVEQLRDLMPGEFEFDYEPVAYTVASCVHYGLVTCPPELSYAREELERMTPHADELRSEVKKRAAEVHDPVDHPYGEDAVGVQLALLASVTAYCDERRRAKMSEFEEARR